ncbi:MAG: hypothetical protein Q8P20_00675 [bacterium]|nr:hypothetical protein [bacterium]
MTNQILMAGEEIMKAALSLLTLLDRRWPPPNGCSHVIMLKGDQVAEAQRPGRAESTDDYDEDINAVTVTDKPGIPEGDQPKAPNELGCIGEMHKLPDGTLIQLPGLCAPPTADKDPGPYKYKTPDIHAVKIKGKTLPKVRDIGAVLGRVDADEVAVALGTEVCEPKQIDLKE